MRTFLNGTQVPRAAEAARAATARMPPVFLACFSSRACTSNNNNDRFMTPSVEIAAKKSKSKRRTQVQLDAEKLLKSLPSDPKAEAELSTAELERKVEEWSKMSPTELDDLYKQYEAQEAEESRVLQEDNVMQMDVSMKSRSDSAIRVFWKDVDIREALPHAPGWYNVLVAGKPIKAFESKVPLILPSEDYALACAREWAEQEAYVNKLLMPLTDLASGSMLVAPQAIGPRIDYLLSFFQNDNCYFRTANIQHKQDEMIRPIANWFERVFEVKVPRIVGIGHPNLTPTDAAKVRDVLYAMNLNQFQVVALCVVAQFTASLMLPLAMFNGIVSLPTALQINRAEEGHNVDVHGEIKGYHDIREIDVQTKIAAAATAWQLTSHVSANQCGDVIQGNPEE